MKASFIVFALIGLMAVGPLYAQDQQGKQQICISIKIIDFIRISVTYFTVLGAG